MRLHYLQHVPFEDPDNIAVWAQERGHALSGTRLDLGEPLPPVDAFDWLIVMGGPMNVDEHDRYPWLATERAFIRAAIARGATVLGVCLGAQLAAAVLGGPVTRNPQTEIGWFPLALTAEGKRSPLFAQFPNRFLACHWHGDTFAIPPGAIRIAGSAACANQAFQYGDRVVGLQFHLDYSAAGIQRMVQHAGSELGAGPTIQTAQELLAFPERLDRIRDLLFRLLDALERQSG